MTLLHCIVCAGTKKNNVTNPKTSAEIIKGAVYNVHSHVSVYKGLNCLEHGRLIVFD